MNGLNEEYISNIFQQCAVTRTTMLLVIADSHNSAAWVWNCASLVEDLWRNRLPVISSVMERQITVIYAHPLSMTQCGLKPDTKERIERSRTTLRFRVEVLNWEFSQRFTKSREILLLYNIPPFGIFIILNSPLKYYGSNNLRDRALIIVIITINNNNNNNVI